ncbi:Phosphoadenosine phosphosulfate reductase [Wickerhamomyces ciferrii]|uniref:phosphoadenylyl-sulfate reductase (thioredoxin) n=1 Tax=Wickerhamomyces ciferrii (strain ATCC 14091 / BCRC 22168 / CBS 111 / JCM 3599 / NBRC 0793 / NRRL Y-1031 F-60-10) TaxID=1206466 RepID=K0KV75_WICCF|nr:Phosphoadenosine phosphosulfate reductase [Wickerhamomyces ciferrii]CCH47141.1 Phosphoadenosine phosphosulfate reductase [Wickerhamomyces ciferrii]
MSTSIKNQNSIQEESKLKPYSLVGNSVILSEEYLDHLNKTLIEKTPQEIIEWSIETFPNLFQTTAFGLTGLVTVDILSKLPKGFKIELIFIDTLHHFPQTLDLVSKIQSRYPNNKINIYKPLDCNNEFEFSQKHGESLWETNDEKYDYYAKVEPTQRSYRDLKVSAVFTGRRRSQGGARNSLPIIEIEESSGIIKINPFANWSFQQVLEYIKNNNVPYNELLDLGYRSVGDYHSTLPVKEGEDERAGRWKGQNKTECGIHETSKFAKYLKESNSTRVE